MEWACCVFAFGCVMTNRPLLALAVCAMGSALCVVGIGRRDGWL